MPQIVHTGLMRFLIAFFLQELPRRISTDEEREILSLLCKVHELEIEKVEMRSEAVLKDSEWTSWSHDSSRELTNRPFL